MFCEKYLFKFKNNLYTFKYLLYFEFMKTDYPKIQ